MNFKSNCPPAGMYVCSQCNHPLFSSRSKFAHSSPWPAFTDTIREDSVTKMMETLTAYKVRHTTGKFLYFVQSMALLIPVCFLLLLHHSRRSNISSRMWLCFVCAGSVWQVWQRSRPRVCKWRPRRRNLTFLNIQPLAQVCPQQR